MILRTQSRTVRVLCTPPLMWFTRIEACRVQNDCTSFVRVTFSSNILGRALRRFWNWC